MTNSNTDIPKQTQIRIAIIGLIAIVMASVISGIYIRCSGERAAAEYIVEVTKLAEQTSTGIANAPTEATKIIAQQAPVVEPTQSQDSYPTIEANNIVEPASPTNIPLMTPTSLVTNKNPISTEGLVAYFSFNGSADDNSTRDNDGIVDGVVLIEDRFENPNSAYYFNGRSSITIPDSPSLDIVDAYTFMVWIQPASFDSTWQSIFSKGSEPRETYALFLTNDGRLHYVLSLNGARHNWNSSRAITQTGQWYHVAIVFDGTTIKSFVNGEKTGQNEAIGTIASNNYNLEFGMRAGGNFYQGGIDELYIFNRALSDSEIEAFFEN